MVDKLNDAQKSELLRYLEVMTYDPHNRLIFGPKESKYFREFRNIFLALEIGWHSTCVDFNVKEEKRLYFMFVDFVQADRLLSVLAQLTGKSILELTDNKYRARGLESD
jgi:hypothetical protein